MTTYYIDDNLQLSTTKYIWSFDKYLICSNKYLNYDINKNVYQSTEPNTIWTMKQNQIMYNNKYLSINCYLDICLLDEPERQLILFIDNSLTLNVPPFKQKFIETCKKYNISKNILKYVFDPHNKINDKHNIGILLASGLSTRFGEGGGCGERGGRTVKQLYIYKKYPLFMYSLKILCKTCHTVIIICNDTIVKNVYKFTKHYKNVTLVINNINCRLKSIYYGLNYIRNNYDKTENISVIIHDSARPGLKKYHIINLMRWNKEYKYIHYCEKIKDGLYDKNNFDIDREDYVLLCSPLIINFNMAYLIYKYFICVLDPVTFELVHVLKLMNIEHKFLFDDNLKKITNFSDTRFLPILI